jgi:hypothetical protein
MRFHSRPIRAFCRRIIAAIVSTVRHISNETKEVLGFVSYFSNYSRRWILLSACLQPIQFGDGVIKLSGDHRFVAQAVFFRSEKEMIRQGIHFGFTRGWQPRFFCVSCSRLLNLVTVFGKEPERSGRSRNGVLDVGARTTLRSSRPGSPRASRWAGSKYARRRMTPDIRPDSLFHRMWDQSAFGIETMPDRIPRNSLLAERCFCSSTLVSVSAICLDFSGRDRPFSAGFRTYLRLGVRYLGVHCCLVAVRRPYLGSQSTMLIVVDYLFSHRYSCCPPFGFC